MLKKIVIFSFLVVFLGSCTSSKNILYYQNIDSITLKSTTYETVLQPDDLLSIVVIGDDPEAVLPYNRPNMSLSSLQNTATITEQSPYTYLIDNENTINFLGIGKVKVGGLTKAAATQLLVNKLSAYLKNPTVDLRVLNFKISVQGEVLKPGTYSVKSERITILEALSLAGDLSIYAKRTKVLVLRENEGGKLVQRLDLTNADFINSPFYYLRQNDVVYVEPNQTRINSSIVGPNIGIALSGLSLLVTILALTIR